ncbi:MAG: ribonuclease P protein component [Patescibacteria group bacterium]
MLKRENRIRLDKEFDRVFKAGQSFYGKDLGFKLVRNNLEVSRFGILINTKVSKKAVIRNKIKRQIRAILESKLENISLGYDLVIIVFPLILDKKFKEIEKILLTGLSRLKIYEKSL